MNKFIALVFAITAPVLSTLSWCGGRPEAEATNPAAEPSGQSHNPLDEIRQREADAHQRIQESQARVWRILEETEPPSISTHQP